MYNQLCTVENNEMAVRYIYDNEGRRIGKTGEKSIVFAYDEVGNMILESGFDYALSFNYDDEGIPRQLIYNGDKFKFELDSDGNVYRLLDSNNKAIAMYQYRNGETVVYGLDEQNS